MKKTIRIAVALVLALGVCLSLCSCQTLDNMRNRQAFFDKSKNIVYKGDTFKPITITNNDLLALDGKGLTVTERDVPVLLSDYEGTEATLTCDGKIIFMHDDNGLTYCRSDFYDYLKEADKTHQLDTFAYIPTNELDEWKASDLVLFSSSENEEFSGAIERSQKGTYDDMWHETEGGYGYVGEIYLCSKDKIFGVFSYDILYTNNTYYLTTGEEYFKIANDDRAIFDRYTGANKIENW